MSTEEEPCPKETELDVTTVEAKEAWTDRDHRVGCKWTGVLTILGKKHIERIVKQLKFENVFQNFAFIGRHLTHEEFVKNIDL